MAADIDWVARLRTVPSEVCPSGGELQAFVKDPEGVSPEAFSHIIRGCDACREKLQDLVLHPTFEEIEEYLRNPKGVPEQVVMHFASCQSCQRRAEEVFSAD